MSSVKQLAVRGAVWTIASYGLSQVLRLGSNLILTRLLVPEMFGLMSLVYVFITALHLFSDLGIGTSLIQNKRGEEPDFLNTAWTLQVCRGVILWFCTLFLAWPIAHLYQQPQFLWLLPVVGLGTVISGFNSTSVFTLNRNMAFGQLAILSCRTVDRDCGNDCLGLVQSDHLGDIDGFLCVTNSGIGLDSLLEFWFA